MRFKIDVRWWAGLIALALAGNAAGQPQKKKSADPPLGRLVRKDLLAVKPSEYQPALRDIFTPKSLTSAGFVPAGELPGIGASAAADKKNRPGEEEGLFPLNLSYIGYVRSPRKIVALVMIDGQTLSASEGEEILPGFKVEKVSPALIELVGADSRKLSFSLQGE